MTLMQVVLPEPLGPTRPRISPSRKVRLSPSSARKPPKRLTRLSRRRSESGDIDPPAAQQRDQPVGQEEDEAHDQEAVDELKILRRRDADRIVKPVEDDDAEDRPRHRRRAAEEGEDDGEDAEFGAEDGLGIEHRDVPGED